MAWIPCYKLQESRKKLYNDYLKGNNQAFETLDIKYKEKIGWNIKFNDNDYPDLAIVEIENCDKTVISTF